MIINAIYEDEDILILDKPAKITVNRAETTKNEQTVQDFLDKNYPLNIKDDSDFYKRRGIVHRLDKETSGVLIVAKNKKSFENLQSQFSKRQVEKTYIALVHGHVKEKEGGIAVPVGRLPWNRKKFGVLAGGKESFTKYKVLEEFTKPFTLLEIYPKTGRTHQIRVHMKYINHPIFSDLLYAGRKVSREDRKVLDRVFLHAFEISFYHPKTNKRVHFRSNLPKELIEVLKQIRG